MRLMLAQFGACLKWPWTKLEAPELTETLIDRMVEGTQAEAAGRSIRDLERLRDDYLVAIQQVLRSYNIGAGATLRALEERLYQDAAHRDGLGSADPQQDAALPLVRMTVRPEWVDYNGHMSDFRYAQVFGDAMDALYRRVGVDEAYRATGRMFYTVESHVMHYAEVRVAEPIQTTTRIVAWTTSACTSTTRCTAGATGFCWPLASSCTCTSRPLLPGPRRWMRRSASPSKHCAPGTRRCRHRRRPRDASM